MTANTKFEVGTSYMGRHISDYDSVFRYTVVKRTAKFVWLTSTIRGDRAVKKCGIRIWNGVEQCLPFGSYSMSPSLSAGRIDQ